MFKIKARSRTDDRNFETRGLQVLGESVSYTYFVLSDDQGVALRQALDRYISTGAIRSFFDLLDDIEPYGTEDRLGPGIAELLAAGAGRHTVDVSIWPASDWSDAQERVRRVEAVLTRTGGEILLRSVSARRTWLRVNVSIDGLRDVLDTSVVELVRTPPVPFLDFRDWRNAGLDDFSVEVKTGATVGVLDDSPQSGHPLLAGHVLSDESLAPAGYPWQRRGSHGTEVVGRVLYPDLHEELRDVRPLTAVGAVRVVRILEPVPGSATAATRFATYDLPHVVVEQAIRHLHGEYGVRVFNLSAGYAEPFNEVHVGPLTECLDDLIRELKIVVVVPTGNVSIAPDARTPSRHHVIDDKPEYFFTPEHRLSEPAPSALAVTVGSLALSGAAAETSSFGSRVAAEAEEASPFSRSGPGMGTNEKRTNKPDVVHYGGNVVVSNAGIYVANELGASLVSTSFRGSDGRLFAAVNGTSFAVPAVARIAADITHAYPKASSNLVRALLVSSTSMTTPAVALTPTHKQAQVYGFGKPARDLAIASYPNRVTMTYDGQMAIDTVQIHPLPVPEAFRRGSGRERTIAATLAFDPPVRRQRREYLAGSMKIDIYRDIDIEELEEILKRQDPDEPRELVNDKRRLTLIPGSTSFTSSTVHRRRWTAKNSFVNDSETFHVVVTHKAQTWARNDSAYTEQSYALAVTLEDRLLVHADLYQSVAQQLKVLEQVRVRRRA